VAQVVVKIYLDEPVTALWCHQCQLPSVIRVVFHVGHPDSETTFVHHECNDHPEHVLIEDI
jgi:hypothetical protein